MKSFVKSVALGALLLVLGGVARAGSNYDVALTTYVPTASATDFGLGSYPNITGGAYPMKLIIANAGATAQDVSVYDTCTSSTAATLAGVVSLSAAIQTVQVDIPRRTMKLTSPCFIKSATGSTVHLTILYE
jgi:hypothetical protein